MDCYVKIVFYRISEERTSILKSVQTSTFSGDILSLKWNYEFDLFFRGEPKTSKDYSIKFFIFEK
jgi:hypothetical protein